MGAACSMFLGEVEGDRLNRVDPSGATPQDFEMFPPHALSPVVEHTWASRFAGILSGAAQAPSKNSGYSPAWYSGGDWNALGPAGFASSPGGSFSSAISSSSTAPGSSGGGGGGAGGW